MTVCIRPEFTRSLSALLFLWFVQLYATGALAEPAPKNILFVLTDDQRADEWHQMPTIRRLAETGFYFDQAIVTTPVCAAARASILSGGTYARRNGVLNNGDGKRFDDSKTIATALQKAGYRTGFIGKYLHGYTPGYIPPGWDYFVANNNGGMINDWWSLVNITTGSSTSRAEKGEVTEAHRQYITYFHKDKALQFLESLDSRPFFLMVSTYAPHSPRSPANEDRQTVFDLPDIPEEQDFSDKPNWLQQAVKHTFPWTEKSLYEARQNNLRTLQAVDRSVHSLLSKIGELGLASETIIVYSSDNGLLLGEHSIADKGVPYEPAIKVPLVINIPNSEAATVNDLVAMNLDVPATILDLAGSELTTDGISLKPVLSLGIKHQREEALIEAGGYLSWWAKGYGFEYPGLGIWSGVRTPRWKYVEHPTGEKELYDLQRDPNELENIAKSPDTAELQKNLRRQHELLKGTSSAPTS